MELFLFTIIDDHTALNPPDDVKATSKICLNKDSR